MEGVFIYLSGGGIGMIDILNRYACIAWIPLHVGLSATDYAYLMPALVFVRHMKPSSRVTIIIPPDPSMNRLKPERTAV